MVDPILAAEVLRAHGAAISQVVARLADASGLQAEVRDPTLGSELGYCLAFTHWHELGESPFGISALDLLYNRYYWQCAYAARHEALHGPDAGLEQEAFKMLDDAAGPVDLEVINDIDRRVSGGSR